MVAAFQIVAGQTVAVQIVAVAGEVGNLVWEERLCEERLRSCIVHKKDNNSYEMQALSSFRRPEFREWQRRAGSREAQIQEPTQPQAHDMVKIGQVMLSVLMLNCQ